MKGNKTETEDLSSTVLQKNLLDEYSGKENIDGKVMPAHRIFKEAAQTDIEDQQKEERLRRIHTTMAGAKVEHIEPHTFVSENEQPSVEETKTDMNRESEAIFYIRFRRIINVFSEIIGLMGRVDDINLFDLGNNTLNIKYSDDISTSTTLFNVNTTDEECMRTILESAALILDTATSTKIFSSILNKIK